MGIKHLHTGTYTFYFFSHRVSAAHSINIISMVRPGIIYRRGQLHGPRPGAKKVKSLCYLRSSVSMDFKCELSEMFFYWNK